MAFKKIDKEFKLSDSTVNCYGYRLLTSGYQINEYKKNPIGYLMHNRVEGVLVKWEDLRVSGDDIFGKPVINMSHPRGQQTLDEIHDGFLNAASVGHIVPLEVSTDPADLLEGQTGPTVTKWYNRECSLVDIPGNYNALAKLYDAQGNELNLSDFTKPKTTSPKMKQIIFSAAMLASMNLSANAEEAEAHKAFSDLVDKAASAEKLRKELDDLKAKVDTDEIKSALAQALSDKKTTVEQNAELEKHFKGNPTGLKSLLATMKPYVPVVPQLGAGAGIGEDAEFEKLIAGKNWDQLAEADLLESCKAKAPEYFKKVYKDEFKKDYAG